MADLFQFELGQVCSRLSSGKGISAKEVHLIGKYPVFGGNGLRGYTDRSNFEGECAIIGRQGAFCGNVRYFSGAAYMTEHAVVLCANEKNDTRYLAYLLSIMNLGRLSGQSAQPGLSVKSLEKQIVSLPSLSKQRVVADTLYVLDEKIENNSKINHHLEQMVRTLFRHWFEESEEVQGWGVGKLGDFIEINKRSITKNYPYNEIEYIDISSVSVGHLEGATSYSLKDSPSRAKRLVQQGDTIWSTVRPNRKSYLFISNPKENLVVSTGFAVLTPVNIPPSFLYLYTTTDLFVDYLVSNADGSAYPAVLPERFAEAEFPIPPGDKLSQFESIVSPTLAQISHFEEESRMLASLRDSLLPKLMCGELSVENVDAK